MSNTAVSTVEQEASNHDADFAHELAVLLRHSQNNRRGLMFYVRGERIGGGVKEILRDAVVVGNQEFGRILIRFESIDAVAAN